MKKTVSLSLVCALALCLLAACGSEAAEPEVGDVTAAIDSAVESSSMTGADARAWAPT